ncbi:hypothetical protein AALO_G00202470 [Alosa alosa]|uniref:Coiled-coil domain containing 9 n=1 Tax=Alosa alosa TaxID=278164 RepID=A0AAV6G2Y0_9TELE|nr:coiled-coil domain-containing protein 9 isoform X1 [Alosa alosa]KAG5269479.1 hypothetical protein AALO_G00202470 [Alosa alosa]
MSAAVEIKTKEEKDAELDRRIEALRKKNQALVRRYQEIEEDKKKAEDEGIAVTLPRRTRGGHEHDDWPKPEKESFTVTVDLSKPGAVNRVVNDRRAAAPHVSEKGDAPRSGGEGPSHRPGMVWARGGQRGGGPRPERRDPRPERHDPHSDRPPRDDEGGERPARGGRGPRGGRRGRGGPGPGPGPGPDTDRKSKEWEEKRRQNIAMMNEEMEKIAEYERGQKADGEKPIRNFLDDPRRSGPVPDMDRKEGSRRHVRNWGGLDFESVKTGAEMEKEWMSHRSGGKGSVDMTLSMTGRERAEYLRWKKEREQIDEERLARHRNATGQWRREWDAEKTDTMFKETPEGAGDLTPRQGGRRDENKRAPRAPKFGDFLGSGSRDGDRKGRVPKKGRGQDNYSMHDNRWKSEKEEEKGQEEEHETGKEKPSNETTEVKDEVEKPAPAGTSEAGTAEEDEDEWEDASDGDDEDELEDAPDTPPRAPATSSPKERRAPVVHIPPPQDAQASPEGGKPLSPFSPLEGHQPVTDWGEEMEMQSPRTSMEESPLRPSSSSETNTSQENKGQDSTAHTDDFAVAAEVVDKTTEAPAEEAIQQSDSSLPPKEEQTDDAQAPNASKDAEDAEDVVSPTTEPPPNEAEENPPDQPASG